MGLAEPRKRLKISHDPNNLAWSRPSKSSFGQKILNSHGWKPGQGLGARDAKHIDSSNTFKVQVSYKDDTLGLGASVKSKDPEQARVGLDAFQGLLGRLNGKSEVELKQEVQKIEDRKLAMWAQGRWGGMIFVPGGTLVQGDEFKQKFEEQEEDSGTEDDNTAANSNTDERGRREGKKKRKEERRRRRQEKLDARAQAFTTLAVVESSGATPKRVKEQREDLCEGQTDDATVNLTVGKKKEGKKKEEKKKRRHENDPVQGQETKSSTPPLETQRDEQFPERSTPPEETIIDISTTVESKKVPPRTGRHVIRGRNILAKKMAFVDAKMLDEIFMRKS